MTLDYGVGDPATTELRIVTPGGRRVLVDSSTAIQGTLTWDRKIDGHHVTPGPYQLEVTSTNAGGTSRATRIVTLGLLYVEGPPKTTRKNVVLRYTLATAAQVRLYVTRNGHTQLVERRSGFRGHNHITWDYRIGGRRVPAGRYFLTIRATA